MGRTTYDTTVPGAHQSQATRVGGARSAVHQDGIWQDADHVWRSGRPDCLRGTGDAVGPVDLGVVEGSDDGTAWEEVVWVGCH